MYDRIEQGETTERDAKKFRLMKILLKRAGNALRLFSDDKYSPDFAKRVADDIDRFDEDN